MIVVKSLHIFRYTIDAPTWSNPEGIECE